MGLCPLTKSFKDGPQRRPARGNTKGVVASGGPRIRWFNQIQGGKQVEPSHEDVGRDVLWRIEELRARTRHLDHQVSKNQHRPLVADHFEHGTGGAHGTPVDIVDGHDNWCAPLEPKSR